MFFETLNNYILTWIENGKLKYLFSDKKKPDIVLTDKKDIAVALKYNVEAMIAPVVLEKSRNTYTQKIMRLCMEKDIPIVEDRELANDLFSGVKTGQTIPYKHYEEVAKLYGEFVNVNTSNDENGISFTNIFEIQRDEEYETLSIKLPEKIQLELSHGMFGIIGNRRFLMDINALTIHNIKVKENANLKYDEFIIKINGTAVKQGNINYSNIDPFDQLTIHLSGVLKKFSKELIGRDEIVHFIDQLKQEAPILVDEIMKYYSTGEIRKVLHGLLTENVPIQNLVTIFETMADFGPDNHNIESIIEAVRQAIGRSICLPYLCEGNILRAICFDHEFEKSIIEKDFCILSKTLSDAFNTLDEQNIKPIIICRHANRQVIKKVTEQFSKDVVVLSVSEIPNDIKVEYILEIKEKGDTFF